MVIFSNPGVQADQTAWWYGNDSGPVVARDRIRIR